MDPLGLGNRDAIEDAALAFPRTRGPHAPRFALVVGHVHNGKRKVGAVERGDYLQGVLQAKGPGDVLADPRGRRRRQRDHGRALVEPLDERADLAVVAAEVVAPFADAVGLVDGERGIVRFSMADRKAGLDKRSGVTYRIWNSPLLMRFRTLSWARRLSVLLRKAGCKPRSRTLPHLVAHERDQGETTMVVPPSATAGTW